MDDKSKTLPLTFTCLVCNISGQSKIFKESVMTIAWREKYKRMDAFVRILCPRCKTLLSITFEFMTP